MANDINDDPELLPDHAEAWSLAHHKRGTSNMARAYIDMREALAALAAQVKKCGEASIGIFQIAAVHGASYSGPNWTKELEKAEHILSAVDD